MKHIGHGRVRGRPKGWIVTAGVVGWAWGERRAGNRSRLNQQNRHRLSSIPVSRGLSGFPACQDSERPSQSLNSVTLSAAGRPDPRNPARTGTAVMRALGIVLLVFNLLAAGGFGYLAFQDY